MVTDDWDITHICIAVPDLEAAMERYARAFGIDWGPIALFSSDHFAVTSTILDDGFGVDGLRAVWAKNGSAAVAGAPPFAPFELMHAAPGSPAFAIWGCRDGREYLHHVCYWSTISPPSPRTWSTTGSRSS